MSELEDKMEYAIRLAYLEEALIWEEMFKLASLCAEITIVRKSGESADEHIENEFSDSISTFYRKSGKFRQAIEQFPDARVLFST